MNLLHSKAASPQPSKAARQFLPSLLTAALLACGGGAVHAESLQEVYNAALAYDATYLSAKSQSEAAQYKAEQAKALMRPSLGLTGSYTYSRIDPPIGNDNLSAKSRILGVKGAQPIFRAANAISIEQANRALDLAQSDLRLAENDLIIRVAQAYFDVLAAQNSLSVAQASKKAISEQLASAKRNFEVGTATITDTREAQARFDLANAQEIAASNDLRVKHIALDQLVGQQDIKPNDLAKEAVLPPLNPDNVDDWIQRSETSPVIRKALLADEIAQLEIDKAKSGHLPTLDLVASLTNAHNTGNGVQVNSRGTTNTASIGVQLDMPLYAGGAVQNRVKEALSLREKSTNDLAAARRSIAQSTRQAFFGLQSGQAQVKALEAAEASTKLALDAIKLGYKVGVRVNLDVLNAQTQLFNTQRDLAKARYDVLVNHLRLRQIAGTLQPSDLDLINQLIAHD